MKHRKKGQSVQELMGLKGFTDYGLQTDWGELLLFEIMPTNISVLSCANIESKIRHLMMILSAMPDIEITCTDASECFDGNRAYMTERKEREENRRVRDIIAEDIRFLDRIESEMSTARQFVIVGRCKGQKPEQVFRMANSIEKTVSDQGFEVRRMNKQDIKRLLALYFDASYNGEQLPDVDGEQYFELGGGFGGYAE